MNFLNNVLVLLFASSLSLCNLLWKVWYDRKVEIGKVNVFIQAGILVAVSKVNLFFMASGN